MSNQDVIFKIPLPRGGLILPLSFPQALSTEFRVHRRGGHARPARTGLRWSPCPMNSFFRTKVKTQTERERLWGMKSRLLIHRRLSLPSFNSAKRWAQLVPLQGNLKEGPSGPTVPAAARVLPQYSLIRAGWPGAARSLALLTA